MAARPLSTKKPKPRPPLHYFEVEDKYCRHCSTAPFKSRSLDCAAEDMLAGCDIGPSIDKSGAAAAIECAGAVNDGSGGGAILEDVGGCCGAPILGWLGAIDIAGADSCAATNEHGCANCAKCMRLARCRMPCVWSKWLNRYWRVLKCLPQMEQGTHCGVGE